MHTNTIKAYTKPYNLKSKNINLLFMVRLLVLLKCGFYVESFVACVAHKLVFTAVIRHVVLQRRPTWKGFTAIFTPVF